MIHLIEATVMTGYGEGDVVFIPRLHIEPSDCPFNFKRLQFPVKPAFAMSMNRSQGQTFQVVGLHLIEPCFFHGQVYVAVVSVTFLLFILCAQIKE